LRTGAAQDRWPATVLSPRSRREEVVRMRFGTLFDRALAVAAAIMGVVSIFLLNDADKAPLYFLLAYLFFRIRSRYD
jgi:hypothetical protein